MRCIMNFEISSKEIFIDQYYDKSTDLIEKIEHAPFFLDQKTHTTIEKLYKFTNDFLNSYDKFGNKIIEMHYNFVTYYKAFVLSFYRAARYTSIPWNYIWLYLWKKYRYAEGNLLMARGVHYITALQGGGKSTIVYDLMEELRDLTGKASYVNAELEKPRLDELSNYMIKYHKFFELGEFFGETYDYEKDKYSFTQKKRFNTDHFDNIVLEEWLSEMNHRSNNTSEYKAKFIPLMQSLARMRHQYIKRVYITSQLDTTDIQLMGLFKYIHEVEIDLDIDYWQWVEDGMFCEHIKGWTVYTYQYKRNKKKGATEKALVRKWYKKRFSDMKYFESLNQASNFYRLPMDQVKTTKGVI